MEADTFPPLIWWGWRSGGGDKSYKEVGEVRRNVISLGSFAK